MLNLVWRRFTIGIAAIWVIWSSVFFLSRCIPGDAFQSEDKQVSAATIANHRKHFHLDEPILWQYVRHLKGLIRLEIPPSMRYVNQDVKSILKEGLGPTLITGVIALFFSLILGLGLGWLAALHQNTRLDDTIMASSVFMFVWPANLRILWLVEFFAITLKLLPTSGWDHPIAFKTAFMPIVALALPGTMRLIQLSRASLIEVLNSNYIKTARAKGLSESYIFKRHAFIPALIPLLSTLADLIMACLTGSILVEKLHGIPGIGGKLHESAAGRDYNMVTFLILVMTALSQTVFGLAELAQYYLDPRLRDKKIHLH